MPDIDELSWKNYQPKKMRYLFARSIPGLPATRFLPRSLLWRYGEPEQGVNVREIRRTVRKRKWLIAVMAAIVTTLVTIEAYRDKSIYQATATIEIGKDTGTVVKLGDLLLQTDDFNSLIGIRPAC